MLIITDNMGRIEYANPATEQLLDMDSERLLGSNILDHVCPEDMPGLPKRLEELSSKPEKSILMEICLLRRDGSKLPVKARAHNLLGIPRVNGIMIDASVNADETPRHPIANSQGELDGIISLIITPFIYHSSEKLDDCINFTLRSIGQFSDADRFGVFLRNESDKTFSKTHEWCDMQIEGTMEMTQSVDLDLFKNWGRLLNQMDTVAIGSLDELSPKDDLERTFMEERGIKSIICAPMVSNEELVGFMSYETVSERRSWDIRDILMVKTVGNIITSAVVRKRAEDDLKRSEERFKQLFELAPDGIYINDMDGNFLDGNQAAQKLIGYEKDEILGKNMLEVGLLPEDQLEKAAMGLGESMDGNPYGPAELDLLRKDGRRITVEIMTHPIRIANETMILGMVRDLSRRKKAERDLRESEARYRMLFEHFPGAIALIDLEGTLIECNDGIIDITGEKKEDLIGKNFGELETMREEDLLRFGEMFMESLASGDRAPMKLDLDVFPKNAPPRRVNVNACVLEKDGEPHSIIVVVKEKKRKIGL